MEIDDLMQPLPVAENPGLEPFDPRVVEISTLAQNGDYAGAALQAVEILEEGIYDIRIIGFYLYGVFAEGGGGTAASLFRCATSLLTLNWEAVGPGERKEKHVQSSLNWLMKSILKKLQSEEAAKGETWDRWMREADNDTLEDALDAAAELQRNLGLTLAEASKPVTDTLTKIVEQLRSLQQLIYSESSRQIQPESESMDAGEDEAPEALRPWSTAGSPSASSTRNGDDDAVLVEGSYHLKVLMKKLDLFERLIEHGKIPRAAIVANDINTILAGFDPKLYFPKLFAKYLYLLAVNVSDLMQYDENKESMEWQAMSDFYKVDMDGFFDI